VLYEKAGVNWRSDYEKIIQMSKHQLYSSQAALLRDFPDAYSYSKSMAEVLMT